MTVAIVDAMDDVTAEADLQVYRSYFGLPECSSSNGCFQKVGQTGSATDLPSADVGWGLEESLDVDMVSAVCPNCKIILVEANSTATADLGAAVATAVNMGANVISNSYGGSEYSGETTDSELYNQASHGVIVTVSAGDSGYGVEFPAASQYVTAVGGTTLTQDSSTSRGWTEAVWGSSNNSNGGTGSGCSAYIPKPSWQKDTGCSKRTVADVAAVADPSTGVVIYDSTPDTEDGFTSGGWIPLGGTSVASPLTAAIYALAGNSSTLASTYAESLYSNTDDLNNVPTGENGSCSNYLCKGGAGYNGPTGNGTANGVGAF